jgi:hypothetical protein
MNRIFVFARRVSIAAFSICVASCGDDSGQNVGPVPRVARIDVTPQAADVDVTGTQQYTAFAFDAQGQSVSGTTFSWSTSSSAVASVSSNGLATGVAPGNATVTAATGGVTGSASIRVILQTGPIARVEILPNPASVFVSATIPLTATAYDAQGRPLDGTAFTYTSGNTSIATVNSSGVVTGVAAGTTSITARTGTFTASASVTVHTNTSLNVIDVIPSVQHQTITGWEGHVEAGQVDCPATSFAIYRDPLLDRVVNELGLNRVRLEFKSGMENTVDYFAQYRAGQINYDTWRASQYTPVNDNADPNLANPAGFQWAWFDTHIDQVVNPLRQRLQARGEQLFVTVTFVDFWIGGVAKPFQVMRTPAEYAELVLMVFQHIRNKYGWAPDALEIALEPENQQYNGVDMGRAIVATVNRLAGAGFHPQIIAPSTASMANAPTYYDAMIGVPGVSGLIDELSYHRYAGVSSGALQAIASRASRDGLRTSMLEHIGSGIEDLWTDLTEGNVSAWEQFAIAFCGAGENPNAAAIYYHINTTNPSAPTITLSNRAKLLRQVFLFVRAGAVRIGATSTNSNQQDAIAFRNSNGRYVVIVRAQGATSFTVRGLPAGTYGLKYSTVLAYDVNLPDVTIGNGAGVQSSMPGGGYLTIYQR